MSQMSEAFRCDVALLENELVSLIMDDSVAGRIDSHNKVLYKRRVDQRQMTFEKALSVGEEYERLSKATLLRVAMVSNKFCVGGEGGPGAGSDPRHRGRGGRRELNAPLVMSAADHALSGETLEMLAHGALGMGSDDSDEDVGMGGNLSTAPGAAMDTGPSFNSGN